MTDTQREAIIEKDGSRGLVEHFYSEWVEECARKERLGDASIVDTNLGAIIDDWTRCVSINDIRYLFELTKVTIKDAAGETRDIGPENVATTLCMKYAAKRQKNYARRTLERAQPLAELTKKVKADPKALKDVQIAMENFILQLRYDAGEKIPLAQRLDLMERFSAVFDNASAADVVESISVQCSAKVEFRPAELTAKLKDVKLTLMIKDNTFRGAMDEVFKALNLKYKFDDANPDLLIVEPAAIKASER